MLDADHRYPPKHQLAGVADHVVNDHFCGKDVVDHARDATHQPGTGFHRLLGVLFQVLVDWKNAL